MRDKAIKRRVTSEISIGQKIGLGIVAIFVFVPLAVTFLGGFKNVGEMRTNPFGMPESWSPHRFIEIITGPVLFPSMWNSLVISLVTVALTITLASMAAFALSHIRFFGRKMLMSLLLVGAAVAVLPLFLMLRNLGLLDTQLGIILAQTAFNLSFSILLFHNFFSELPTELTEAARMDNCGYVRIYFYITLPLSLPIIATVGVFAFVGSWNNFLLPLITLNVAENYTWPLGIMQFKGEYSTDWPRILAYLRLTILPAIAFFLAAQKYIVAGLTGGAVKG